MSEVFECRYKNCGESFSTKSGRGVHESNGHEEPPIASKKCVECNKSFEENFRERDKQICFDCEENKENIYCCEFSGCSYRGPQQGLATHVSKSHGNENYHKNYCSLGIDCFSEVCQEILLKERDDVFECRYDDCSELFETQKGRSGHESQVHGENKNETIIKVCDYCGDSFDADHEDRRFCSRSCTNNWQIETDENEGEDAFYKTEHEFECRKCGQIDTEISLFNEIDRELCGDCLEERELEKQKEFLEDFQHSNGLSIISLDSETLKFRCLHRECWPDEQFETFSKMKEHYSSKHEKTHVIPCFGYERGCDEILELRIGEIHDPYCEFCTRRRANLGEKNPMTNYRGEDHPEYVERVEVECSICDRIVEVRKTIVEDRKTCGRVECVSEYMSNLYSDGGPMKGENFLELLEDEDQWRKNLSDVLTGFNPRAGKTQEELDEWNENLSKSRKEGIANGEIDVYKPGTIYIEELDMELYNWEAVVALSLEEASFVKDYKIDVAKNFDEKSCQSSYTVDFIVESKFNVDRKLALEPHASNGNGWSCDHQRAKDFMRQYSDEFIYIIFGCEGCQEIAHYGFDWNFGSYKNDSFEIEKVNNAIKEAVEYYV